MKRKGRTNLVRVIARREYCKHRYHLVLWTRVLREKGESDMQCFESMNKNLTEILTSFL